MCMCVCVCVWSWYIYMNKKSSMLINCWGFEIKLESHYVYHSVYSALSFFPEARYLLLSFVRLLITSNFNSTWGIFEQLLQRLTCACIACIYTRMYVCVGGCVFGGRYLPVPESIQRNLTAALINLMTILEYLNLSKWKSFNVHILHAHIL